MAGRRTLMNGLQSVMVVVLVAGALAACASREPSGSTTKVPPPPIKGDLAPVQTVPDQETVVELGGGARLIIPPGAMAAGATVRASYKNPPKGEWGPLRPLAAPVELVSEPPDAISGVLTLEFPVGHASHPESGGEVGISTFDASTNSWTDHPSTYDSARQYVVAQIAHFSWWNPFSWDWPSILARINQRVGEMVGKRAPAARCERRQAPPGWATAFAGITKDGAIAVRACAEGEGDVLAVELVNNRPYSMVLKYGSGVKWGWHEKGDSAQDVLRNGLADRFVRSDELYLPPRGRASVGILKTSGHKVFSAGVTSMSLAIDALDHVLKEKIEKIPGASPCLKALWETPVGEFSPGRVRDGVDAAFTCVVRHASALGYFDRSTISQLDAITRKLTVAGQALKIWDYEWKFLDLFVDWKVGDAGGLGAGFSFLGRADPLTGGGPGTGAGGSGNPGTPAPPVPAALRFAVTGSCTTAGGTLRSNSSGFTPGGRYTIKVFYPDGRPYTNLTAGSSGTVRSDGSVVWNWDCTGDPPGRYTTELADESTGRSTGRVAFSIGGSQPPQTPPTTQAPPPVVPPTTGAATNTPSTREGTVNGCNTYGQECEGNPIYRDVPPPGYNYRTWPKVTTVANGTRLTARCWAEGGTTWNYAASHNPPDYGPNPYESTIYFNVRAPNGEWGWIPDTYFVRDKQGRMGLPRC